MTGTIWTVGGSESIANRENWPALNCRRQVSIHQGMFLDRDNNVVLDWTPGDFGPTFERICNQYKIDSSCPDMLIPDLEYGGWTDIKLAGPGDPRFDSMASELSRCMADFRKWFHNAAHIGAYALDYANVWQQTEASSDRWYERQRSLIERCPEITCLQPVLYRDRDKPSWDKRYRQSLEYSLEHGAEQDLVVVAQISYRFSPTGDEPERFMLKDREAFRSEIKSVIKDAKFKNHTCTDIGVWDQAKTEWRISQKKNPDGSWMVTTPRQNHIRVVLTAELIRAGVDIDDPAAVQAYWNETANNAYLDINEAMGWDIAEPPKVVPIEALELIEEQNEIVIGLAEVAEAATRDVTMAAEYQGKLIAATMGIAE